MAAVRPAGPDPMMMRRSMGGVFDMLEDEFSDVLTKAMRGTGKNVSALARETGLSAESITSWRSGKDTPGEDEARALGAALGLDPGKLADSAARRWHPDAIALPDVRHHPQHPHPSNG